MVDSTSFIVKDSKRFSLSVHGNVSRGKPFTVDV